MEFISAENFLEQPEKVQDAFKVWLEDNLNVHDWVKLIEEDAVLWVDSVMDTRKDNVDVGRVFYLGRCVCWSSIHEPNIVPLLTETQLRKFIKDKGYRYIGINNFLECVEAKWNIKIFKNMMQFEPDMEFCCKTPLECYWKAACQIAQEG